MSIFSYPKSEESLQHLQHYCDELSLPKPFIWQHQDLHRQLNTLLSKKDTIASDLQLNATIATIPETIIVFHRLSAKTIQAMMRCYKADKHWPIFAVITAQSRAMTLSVLFEHLLVDRWQEAIYKENLKKPMQDRRKI